MCSVEEVHSSMTNIIVNAEESLQRTDTHVDFAQGVSHA